MTTIERLTYPRGHDCLPSLMTLLADTVNGGASIGFIPPLAEDESRGYWLKVLEKIAEGSQILLVARLDGVIVGTVQLELVQKANGLHRAEVQKLMVHHNARGQGIAGLLMTAVETEAANYGRTLLVLDTRRDDTAEHLYRKWGWIEAGIIPQFALNGEGTLDDTVIFYKIIP